MQIELKPHTRLRYFCSPQHTDSAFYPIIRQMERAAGFTHADDAQAKLDKLDAVLALASTSKQDAALFAEMLSLPNDGRYPTVELTPQQRRQKTLEALHAQVETFAREGPVLMILEDAHWSDPTSLEAIGRAVDRIANIPVLLLITFRPEFEPPWIGQPHVTALTINRMTRHEIEAMIDRVAGNKAMPANIRQEIIERTDGIPLFVEEMTKAVLEAESQSAGERTVAAIPSAAMAVPATLHASLMARLDRLGSAKEIAQIGAAIGREFSHALLAAVARKPEGELNAVLDRLVQSGLLFRQGLPPHASYLFKHALVQDAAYGTLLREPRRALHALVAETMEKQFAEIADSQPELLARHFTEAGQIEKSALFWGKAGERSVERSALVEAVELLTRALDQIATLPRSPAQRREQIKLQVTLANVLMHTKGYAAPETRAALDQARSLIEQAEALGEAPDDPLLLFSILYGFWASNLVAFNGSALRDLAAQFLAIAKKQKATGPLMIGHRLMATSLTSTGDLVEGLAHYDQALALYDPAEHRSLATRFGQDVRVVILSFRSWVLWVLGYPDAARADTLAALEHARKIGHAASLMYALFCAPWVFMQCGDYAAAKARSDELITLADEKGSLFWKAIGMRFRGCVLALTGQSAEAIQCFNSTITTYRSSGTTAWMPFWLSYLAKTYADVGRLDDAWKCSGEAIAAVAATKERIFEAGVHRVAGEIALKEPEPDTKKAQSYFERALAVARQQQAKSWELRAAMSMARLWRDQGKVQQARELLAPVYGWFTEGFNTRDLKEAKALLEELAS